MYNNKNNATINSSTVTAAYETHQTSPKMTKLNRIRTTTMETALIRHCNAGCSVVTKQTANHSPQ